MKTTDRIAALLTTLLSALDAARVAEARASCFADHGGFAATRAALEDEARANAALDAARVAAIPALVAELLAAIELAARAAAKARDSVDAPMPSPACDLNLADAGEALPAAARAATRAACDIVLAREVRAEAATE